MLVQTMAAEDRSASLVARFDSLGDEANLLAEQSRQGIDARLLEAEQRASATQQWLLWAIMALVPASLILAALFWLFVLRPLRAIDRAISDLGRGAFPSRSRSAVPQTWRLSGASSNGCARACWRLRSSATVSCGTCRMN
jgi:hypothetical protein